MINKVILVGHLGADPEVRYTADGTAVANFRMATTTRYKNSAGEAQEKTEWHRVVAWRRLGEICAEYLTKGKLVYVEGRLQTRQWEDKDGQTRYTTEIVAQEMKMLGPKGSTGAETRPRPAEGSAKPKPAPAPDGPDDFEDDIPF